MISGMPPPPVDLSLRSKELRRVSETPAAKKRGSFHNLRQLFKFPSRNTTPVASDKHGKQNRRMSTLPQNLVPREEPRTHRLRGPISPTRARGVPPGLGSMPNLNTRSSRPSTMLVDSTSRNVSDPLPKRYSNYPRPMYSPRENPHAVGFGAPRHAVYATANDLASAPHLPPPTTRRVFTDITKRINSPQDQLPKPSFGPRNSSQISIPSTSGPTISECQNTSPPRPVFINEKQPMRRADRSLSVLNENPVPNSAAPAKRPPIPFSKGHRASTSHSFAENVSSLLRTAEPTTATTGPATPPQPVFTTNPRCIYTAQPHAYWAGRFTALHDQYHDQMLMAAINDTKLLQSFLRPSTSTSNAGNESNFRTPSSENLTHVLECEPSTSAIESDEVRRCKRVFYTLQGLCVTVDAKRSLWGFQLRWARERKMEACLPDGGTLERQTEKVGAWSRIARRGRSMTSGSLGETY